MDKYEVLLSRIEEVIDNLSNEIDELENIKNEIMDLSVENDENDYLWEQADNYNDEKKIREF